MVKKTGKFVITSLGLGIVGHQLSSATGVDDKGMTANMMQGSSKIIQPTMKIKGASMVLKSVGKLKKKSKSIKL